MSALSFDPRAAARRRYRIKAACDRAIRELRDLEDEFRIAPDGLLRSLDQEVADRARECHELITERLLNGRLGDGLSPRQMQDVILHAELYWLHEVDLP